METTRAPAKKKSSEFGPKAIIRYANRRLYSVEKSNYITLDDIGQMIQEVRGQDIEVFDKTTRAEVTDEVLIAYIAQRVRSGKLTVPRAVLFDLIESNR